MWAMIPMLRVRESGNSRIASPPLAPLAFRSTAVSVTTISSFHSCGSAGAQLGTPTSSSASPAVMGEGLVGLGHLVGVLRTLDRGHRIVARLAAALLERRVHDPLGQRALALEHDLVDELGHQLRLVDRVRRERPATDWTLARHALFPLPLSCADPQPCLAFAP